MSSRQNGSAQRSRETRLTVGTLPALPAAKPGYAPAGAGNRRRACHDAWNAQLRNPGGGDSRFLCSVVALDADTDTDTGEYVWHDQTTPNESCDDNPSMDMVTATLELDGTPRKVRMQAPKNGFFYVLDREDGALISAEKIGKVRRPSATSANARATRPRSGTRSGQAWDFVKLRVRMELAKRGG